MKKVRVLLACTLCLLSFIAVGCKKNKVVPIENNIDSCKELNGSWKRVVRTESDLCTDPEDPNTCVAEITYLTTSVISFDMDLNYSLEIQQNLEKFLPIVDNCPYKKEQVAANVYNHLKVDGTYAANSYVFQVVNKTVTLDDGETMPVEEFAKIEAAVGTGIQESIWSIEDDILSIGVSSSDVRIEYRRVK